MASKQDEKLQALHSALEGKIAALTDSAEWTAWLDTARRFHRYSFNNVLLILIQRPDATQVAGFRKWQELGRQVRKGEKGLSILAPRTITEKDDETGEKVRRVIGYRAVAVFDIAQTDGDPLPEQPLPVLLEGQAPVGLWDALAKVVADSGYSLTRGDCDGANGWTRYDINEVRVRDDVSDAQAAKTLIHECAHMLLHESGHDHRGVAEVEAESVAYLVATAHGLPTDSYTLPYVAGWGGDDASEKVADTGTRVLKAAKTIMNVTTQTVPTVD